jgi:hypothetical protein
LICKKTRPDNKKRRNPKSVVQIFKCSCDRTASSIKHARKIFNARDLVRRPFTANVLNIKLSEETFFAIHTFKKRDIYIARMHIYTYVFGIEYAFIYCHFYFSFCGEHLPLDFILDLIVICFHAYCFN